MKPSIWPGISSKRGLKVRRTIASGSGTAAGGLRREPHNRHDKFAIEVLTLEGHKLGYIPRQYNEIPARLMDAGKRLFVKMESLKKRGRWLEIRLSLYMEDY